MQSGAWADKELMTALASWAELRRNRDSMIIQSRII